MARNDGTKLEDLVALIEGMQLPPGFTVYRRERVYNDEGQQIAELDILIVGQIGTVTHATLFECRDRPSEGAAPASWIEQLDSRRRRMRVDIVVAVSTTGFSPAAIAWAKQANIPLRTVSNLTEDEIREFLSPTAPLLVRKGTMNTFEVVASQDDLPPNYFLNLAELKKIELTRENSDELFLNIETEGLESALEVWRAVLNTQAVEIFADVPATGESVDKIVEATEAITSHYRIQHEDKLCRIDKMAFPATLTQYQSPLPLAEAKSYAEDRNNRVVVAIWQGRPINTEVIAEIGLVLRQNIDVSAGSSSGRPRS